MFDKKRPQLLLPSTNSIYIFDFSILRGLLGSKPPTFGTTKLVFGHNFSKVKISLDNFEASSFKSLAATERWKLGKITKLFWSIPFVNNWKEGEMEKFCNLWVCCTLAHLIMTVAMDSVAQPRNSFIDSFSFFSQSYVKKMCQKVHWKKRAWNTVSTGAYGFDWGKKKVEEKNLEIHAFMWLSFCKGEKR